MGSSLLGIYNYMKKKGSHIKNFLPPSYNAKTKQGYYRAKFPDKYIGDTEKIIFRSGWEYRFLKWCDESENIIKYAAEPEDIIIPYYNPLTKKMQRYFVDTFLIIRDKDGNEIPWIIEIKPSKYIKPPAQKGKYLTEKKMNQFAYHAKMFIMNQAKFKAAKKYAAQKGMKFGIITESFFAGKYKLQ